MRPEGITRPQHLDVLVVFEIDCGGTRHEQEVVFDAGSALIGIPIIQPLKFRRFRMYCHYSEDAVLVRALVMQQKKLSQHSVRISTFEFWQLEVQQRLHVKNTACLKLL